MRVRQYVYFAVVSDTLEATEMTARVGLAPDEIRIRGASGALPPRPAAHAWKLTCRDAGQPLDEMISRLLDRLEPYAERIARLVEDLNRDETGPSAVLRVVRYFNDEEGEEEDTSSPDPAAEKYPGQHHLLGWHLDRRTLRFLASVHADLDVDEYG
ncbi:DUF4279 domain-containing protein [Sphaerisporangium album]|uniref:DUF4279 domain-containing protein n=1 Tax=Sphaerisporangium album TaxID=509200 RepID=A0A367EUB7_9ACTN|nr:DUF4279 domain-containing protein [Sphaerisporangium album]RCG20997.1 DUF4279 domain-containing protein [Sphaerisporangium album]